MYFYLEMPAVDYESAGENATSVSVFQFFVPTCSEAALGKEVSQDTDGLQHEQRINHYYHLCTA